jgi:hypothetical protein
MAAFPAKAFDKALTETAIPLTDAERDVINETARFLHHAKELLANAAGRDNAAR